MILSAIAAALLPGIALSCGPAPAAVFPPDTTERFGLEVWQNNQHVAIANGVVHLAAAPFNLVFHLPVGEGVFVHAALDTTTFGPALRGAAFAALPGFEETAMAEALFNPDREVCMAGSAPSYWYFDHAQAHRFDLADIGDGVCRCTRSIGQLWRREDRATIPVDDLSGPLYLVLAVVTTTTGGQRQEEWRRTLELRFNRP